jgi:hypothetical protein
MLDLKLPGYLQSAQVNFYQSLITEFVNSPYAICKISIIALPEIIREELLSGEWKSPDEIIREEAEQMLSSGQDYIRQKYYSGDENV